MRKIYLLLLLLFPLICAGQDDWLKKDQQELREMIKYKTDMDDYNYLIETLCV